MKSHLIILLSLIFQYNIIAAQNIYERKLGPITIDLENVNKLDSAGRQTGVWITEIPNSISVTNYYNGLKDGIEMLYQAYPDSLGAPRYLLSALFEYEKGSIKSFMRFDERSINLGSHISDFQHITGGEMRYGFLPPTMSGYYKGYENGILMNEGPLLMGEEFEIDFEDVGEHIYYDSHGNVIERKIFNKPN